MVLEKHAVVRRLTFFLVRWNIGDHYFESFTKRGHEVPQGSIGACSTVDTKSPLHSCLVLRKKKKRPIGTMYLGHRAATDFDASNQF